MTVLKGIRFIFVLLIVGTLIGACTFPVTTKRRMDNKFWAKRRGRLCNSIR